MWKYHYCSAITVTLGPVLVLILFVVFDQRTTFVRILLLQSIVLGLKYVLLQPPEHRFIALGCHHVGVF